MTTDKATRPYVSLAVKIIYWIATAYMVLLLGYAAYFYHTAHEVAAGFFTTLGYPAYIVYPVAWLKITAIFIVVTHRWNDLRDMAYAAYFINMTLALTAHYLHGDSFSHAALGMAAIPISYLLGNQVRGVPKRNIFGRWTHKGREDAL